MPLFMCMPCKHEENEEKSERDNFWQELNEYSKRLRKDGKVIVRENMKAKGDKVIVKIVGRLSESMVMV